jgi:NAD+ diphosphatase
MLPTFAGAGLDRAAERRLDDAWLKERRADPASRAVVAGPGGVALDGDRLARRPVPEGDVVLLGIEASGAALFAVDEPDAELTNLRDAASVLPREEAGLAAYAAGVLNWHRTHPHCARCGARTAMAEAGFVRSCPVCGAQHHPRTDPVVIMLVLDGDRVLLGRQPSWPAGRYSALAGFVEPGESLEEAVAREVFEEAGVEVSAPRYVASQPWPFPSSLMLGFFADYAGGEPHVRDAELEDVRWFTRDELADTVLPPRLAIARTLIDAWR